MSRRRTTLDKWDIIDLWLTATVVAGAILSWLVLAAGGGP